MGDVVSDMSPVKGAGGYVDPTVAPKTKSVSLLRTELNMLCISLTTESCSAEWYGLRWKIVVWLRKCHCSTKEAYRVANVNEWKVRLAREILPMTLVDDPLTGQLRAYRKAPETPFVFLLLSKFLCDGFCPWGMVVESTPTDCNC